jgi:hypothetical protein
VLLSRTNGLQASWDTLRAVWPTRKIKLEAAGNNSDFLTVLTFAIYAHSVCPPSQRRVGLRRRSPFRALVAVFLADSSRGRAFCLVKCHWQSNPGIVAGRWHPSTWHTIHHRHLDFASDQQLPFRFPSSSAPGPCSVNCCTASGQSNAPSSGPSTSEHGRIPQHIRHNEEADVAAANIDLVEV